MNPKSANTNQNNLSSATNPQKKIILFELSLSKWTLIILALLFLVLILAEIGVAAGWLAQKPITTSFDYYKNIALPILTLILGHYFGSRGNVS